MTQSAPTDADAPKALYNRILAALPQTQCTRCGFPDCAAYAQAIASGLAPINQCPPGGAEGVARLAQITGLPAAPLNPANGIEGPRAMAIIDEAWCIGCTLCIKACPVDAIMGSNKMMHTVIEPWCTGCKLCVPVCPVDCISLENITGSRSGWSAWSPAQAETAKIRYEINSNRHPNSLDKINITLVFQEKPTNQPVLPAPESSSSPAERKRAMIEAALARARAQRESES